VKAVERTPTAADLACAVCRKPGPGLDIDHIVNRGMGGSKERDVPANKIALCRPCHLAKTVGTIKTWVEKVPAAPVQSDNWTLNYCWRKRDSDLVFRIPVEVSARYGCLIPTGTGDPNVTLSGKLPGGRSSVPVAGEGVVPSPQVALEYPLSPSPVFAGPGLAVTDVGAQPGPALMNGEGAERGLSSNAAPLTPSPFSLEDWMQEGERLLTTGLQLKGLTDEWRYRIGDWVAAGEQNLGEEAYGHFTRFEDAFGASHLRALGWVAARVSRETRQISPSWTHAKTVAALTESDQRAALITAKEEGLSTRALAVLVRPERTEETRAIPQTDLFEIFLCPKCGHKGERPEFRHEAEKGSEAMIAHRTAQTGADG